MFERPKMGFAAPVSRWLREDLRELVGDTLLSARFVDRGYVAPAALRSAVDDHLAGRSENTRILWTFLMLELWHRSFIDDPLPAQPCVADR